MDTRLIVLLGDQLSPSLLRFADRKTDHIMMAEVVSEATYVAHHKKKIAYHFAAMRHFADELRADGWKVLYRKIDDADNKGDLREEIQTRIAECRPDVVVGIEPGEWRIAEIYAELSSSLAVPFEVRQDDRFICSRSEFAKWAHGRRQLRMENFYRIMRRKTGYLMEGEDPVGGQWNFDHDNRKKAPKGLRFPGPLAFVPDAETKAVLSYVDRHFSDHFGDLESFEFAVTRAQARQALEHFIRYSLADFGTYQDAMLRDENYLYHSLISLYLNTGLLEPDEVCGQIVQAYFDGTAPLNSVEGYLRQVLGWREYMRGIYWLRMPEFRSENFLDAHHNLPSFFWTGETKMECVRQAVSQTKKTAYAHHIQRLMVTGNFALIAGIDPVQVHEWYLAVYADAIEWVELPNTMGMSQFADGGVLASKPYASSGNYINKMSDYCASCHYKVKEKTGPGSCPFNTFYWDFLDRNSDKLRGNPRLGNIYRTWDRFDPEKQSTYRAYAEVLRKELL